MPRSTLLAAAVALLPCALLAQRPDQPRREEPENPAVVSPSDSVTLVLTQPLKARAIGPAVMGGRVSDIALDPKDPYTFYVALGTGGVMKTSDNGGSFDAIFE